MPTRGQKIPITGSVLGWAIDESGWDRSKLAQKLNVSLETLRSWESGNDQPTKTQFNGLVQRLKRPSAIFFLPNPPLLDDQSIDFRSLPGQNASPGPDDLRHLRDARRVQRELSWILKDLGHSEVELFPASIDQDAEEVAEAERERLGISVETQFRWKSDSQAFEAWRTALAGIGVFVFAQQIGRGNIRGFAFKDDQAPVIGVNTTGFNITSRMYTVFHEYAHLLLGQSDVTDDLQPTSKWGQTSDVERWCEQFAASFLVPRRELEDFLRGEFGWSPGQHIDPSRLSRLASKFRVSLRAMALRLKEIDAASHRLFESLGPTPERTGGGGGGARRPVRVKRRYGNHVIDLLREALAEDALGIDEVLDLLGITLDDWSQLDSAARA